MVLIFDHDHKGIYANLLNGGFLILWSSLNSFFVPVVYASSRVFVKSIGFLQFLYSLLALWPQYLRYCVLIADMYLHRSVVFSRIQQIFKA